MHSAGQERFRVIPASFYAHVHCILLCYDITCEQSLDNVKYWNEECNKHAKTAIMRAMVGCKCDLENERQCSKENVREIANECGIDYVIETSAKDDVNLDKLFYDVTDQMVDYVLNRPNYPFY